MIAHRPVLKLASKERLDKAVRVESIRWSGKSRETGSPRFSWEA